MFGTHTTRDGQTIPVAAMDDTHLVNLLKLLFGKIGEVNASIASLDENPTAKSRFQNRLYGLKQIKPEDAADIIREIIDRATPYLLEAYLRGLPEPQDMLRQALGRSAAIPFLGVQPQLSSGFYHSED